MEAITKTYEVRDTLIPVGVTENDCNEVIAQMAPEVRRAYQKADHGLRVATLATCFGEYIDQNKDLSDYADAVSRQLSDNARAVIEMLATGIVR